MVGFLILSLLTVVFIGSVVYWERNSGRFDDGPVALGLVGGFVLIIIWIIASAVTIKTFTQSQGLEAFYYDNLAAYQHTVDDAGRVVIAVTDNNKGVVTDFTNRVESDRLSELRDAVVEYNADLRVLRAWDGLAILGLFIGTPDDELRPIILTEQP